MAGFEEMLKVLGEFHHTEVSRYESDITSLHNKLEQYKKELLVAEEEKSKLNEKFEKTKAKLLMKSQETRHLRELLLKYDISVPPTYELVNISQRNGSRKVEVPTTQTHSSPNASSPHSSSGVSMSTSDLPVTPLFTTTTTIPSNTSIVTNCSSPNITQCGFTKSTSDTTSTVSPLFNQGFITTKSSPPNRKLQLHTHRHKPKISYKLKKKKTDLSLMDDDEQRVNWTQSMIDQSEDRTYDRGIGFISPEQKTRDFTGDDDCVFVKKQESSSLETNFIAKADVGGEDHLGNSSVREGVSPNETFCPDYDTRIAFETSHTDHTVTAPSGADLDASSGSSDCCSPSLLRTSCCSSSEGTEESPPLLLVSSSAKVPPPHLTKNVLINNRSSTSDCLGVTSNCVNDNEVENVPSRKRKKLQTTMTQAFGSDNTDSDTSQDDDDDVMLIPCTLASPKTDVDASSHMTGRHVIPPTPWVRPKTSLTSGWQNVLVGNKAKDQELVSDNDVSRGSLDETIAFFREPEGEDPPQQTGSSTAGTGTGTKMSKTLTYAQQLAKRAGLPTYKCSVVMKKKDDRAKLDGKACPECAKWFTEDDGIYRDPRDHLRKTCRHKKLYHPPDSDPSLWNISFPPDESST